MPCTGNVWGMYGGKAQNRVIGRVGYEPVVGVAATYYTRTRGDAVAHGAAAGEVIHSLGAANWLHPVSGSPDCHILLLL